MEAADHVSLGLRLALLESLTLGDVSKTPTNTSKFPLWKSTLVLRSNNAQSQFLESIESYKPIVQFVQDYKDNSIFLQPPSTLTNRHYSSPTNIISEEKNSKEESRSTENEIEIHSSSSSLSPLSTQSIIALLLESEPDLRQLERDLRMCENHFERDTAGAGKLAEYEPLLPRLAALREQAEVRSKQEADIEARVSQMVQSYSDQIDAISKLFINWDQVLTQTEDALTRLERSRQ